MFGFGKKKRTKKTTTIRKNVALSKDDKKYVNFLIEKKMKQLKKQNKRLTLRQRKEIVSKVKTEKVRYLQTQNITYQNSNMGFFEYYFWFNMFQRPFYHDTYYSQTFINSPVYRETETYRTDNPDYNPSSDRYSPDYSPSSASDYSSSDSSSDYSGSSSSDYSSSDYSSSSSDYSSSSSDWGSSSSDFGSSSSSDFGSSSGGSDF